MSERKALVFGLFLGILVMLTMRQQNVTSVFNPAGYE